MWKQLQSWFQTGLRVFISAFRSTWTNVALGVIERAKPYRFLLGVADLDNTYWHGTSYREAQHLIEQARTLRDSLEDVKQTLSEWRRLSWLRDYVFASQERREVYLQTRESLELACRVFMSERSRIEKYLIDRMHIDPQFYLPFYPEETPIHYYYRGRAIMEAYRSKEPRDKVASIKERKEAKILLLKAATGQFAKYRVFEQDYVRALILDNYLDLFDDELAGLDEPDVILEALVKADYVPAYFVLGEYRWVRGDVEAGAQLYSKAANARVASVAAMLQLGRLQYRCYRDLFHQFETFEKDYPKFLRDDDYAKYVAYFIAYAAYGHDLKKGRSTARSFQKMLEHLRTADHMKPFRSTPEAKQVRFIALFLEKAYALRKKQHRDLTLDFNALKAEVEAQIKADDSWCLFGKHSEPAEKNNQKTTDKKQKTRRFDSIRQVTQDVEEKSLEPSKMRQARHDKALELLGLDEAPEAPAKKKPKLSRGFSRFFSFHKHKDEPKAKADLVESHDSLELT